MKICILLLGLFCVFINNSDAQLIPFKDNETHLYGYKSPTGAIIVVPQYNMVNVFHCGLAAVNKGAVVTSVNANGGKWGFIDSAGHIVIPMQYDFVQDFRGDSARVIKGHKKFIIDKKGNVLDEVKHYIIIRHPTPVDWGKKE